MTPKQIFLIIALIYSIGTIIYFSELYIGYMTFGINPIGLFVDFYFALLIYGIVFLATGNKAGRSVVQYIAGAYQVFFYITLVLLAYLYLTEPQPYFTTGMLVIIMVFSGPQGIYCIALDLAIFEEVQMNQMLIQCKTI